jgi:hypothetical protein
MRHSITVAVLPLIVLAAGAQARAEPIDLKVLYAGDLKHERTEDFRAFLAHRFAKVAVADFLSLTPAAARGFDVVILDWPGLPPRADGRWQIPALGPDYDRPTVVIGGGAIGVARHLQLKIDDLCICLGDAAHGMRTTHPVFHTPHEIKIALEDRPTPSEYRTRPEGARLGPTIKVWKVQDRGWSLERPDDLSTLPGMVSDPYGFEDSPDAEIISSGLNAKSAEGVAIGRHANFLLWGFYSAPSGLTPEGRSCLVNAICYIRKFDGQKPLVRKSQRIAARQWGLAYALAYQEISDPRLFALTQPKSLRDDAAKLEKLRQAQLAAFRPPFSDDVIKALGKDASRYVDYYRANEEFFRNTSDTGFVLEVDEDVKGLGLSNRKLALLERCVSMLEQGDRSDLAARILRRYTPEAFATPREWRAWLNANRRALFFTETGGYKFLVTPERTKRVGTRQPTSATPDANDPVVASAALSPARVQPGRRTEFVVRVKVAPGWHIDGVTRAQGPAGATKLTLALPKGVEAEGEWSCPDPTPAGDGRSTYEGTVEFRRPVRVSEHARGPLSISCAFGYRACTRFFCRLPTTVELNANGEVVNDR